MKWDEILKIMGLYLVCLPLIGFSWWLIYRMWKELGGMDDVHAVVGFVKKNGMKVVKFWRKNVRG